MSKITSLMTSLHEGHKAEERKQGEWIESMYRTYVCSNCGENPTKGTGVTLTLTHLNYEYKYCRFCGAKMRGK